MPGKTTAQWQQQGNFLLIIFFITLFFQLTAMETKGSKHWSPHHRNIG